MLDNCDGQGLSKTHLSGPHSVLASSTPDAGAELVIKKHIPPSSFQEQTKTP